MASQSATAQMNVTGDWSVTASETYANDRIVISNTNSSNGNLYIMPGADLHFDNITLILQNNRTIDNQGYLEINNSSISSPSWLFWLRGAADIRNTTLFNTSHDGGGGRIGTYVTNSSVNFDGVRWNLTGFSFVDQSIHIHAIIDFKNNRIDQRGTLYYELGSISTTANIEIANNRFALGSGMFSRTTGLWIANVQHTGAVTYDIHDNNFTDGENHIYIGASSPSTTYNIHDNTFRGGFMGFSSVEIGQATGSDRFAGNVLITACTFTNVNRGARMYGVIGANVNGTIEGITLLNGANGITANEGNWYVRNSVISNTDPQYQAESNGHIYVRATNDAALNGATTAAGGSIEHFVFLNVDAMTWQNLVPIVGDLVSLRNATGVLNFQVDAQNWTAREIVWWGLYDGQPSLDNRDLRPELQDGPILFRCSPSQFFVSEGMAPISIVCTDDFPPAPVIVRPTPNWLQNTSTLLSNGTSPDYGAGLNTLDWSFDNASWGPVTLGPGASNPWALTVLSVSDGTRTLHIRAVDRVGQATYVQVTPIRVDTTPPPLTMPPLPPFSSGLVLNLTGTTEPFATVSYLTSSGRVDTVAADAGGSFTMTIILSEGQNLIWITAVDLAQNPFTVESGIFVDLVAPSLVVFQNATELTGSAVWTVYGRTEPTAVVRVNGNTAVRNGDDFQFELSLVTGLNPVTVTATDSAGNSATWYGALWSDNEPPTVTVTIATGNVTADGTPVTKAGSVPITGTATDAVSAVASLTINGVAYSVDGAGEFFVSLAVTDGDNVIVVSATDTAGNVRTITRHVLRDSGAPTAVVLLLESDAPLVLLEGITYTTGSSVLISVELSEDGTVTIQGPTGAPQTKSALGASVVFNFSLGEGLNTMAITLRDRAGNLGAPRIVGVTRDTQAPTISLSSPVDGSAIAEVFAKVEGVTEVGANVTVNGKQVSVDAGGGFHTDVLVEAGKSLVITVVATDELGNSDTTSVTVTKKAQDVATAAGGEIPGFLFLAIGVGAGVGVGFMLRGRGRQASLDDLADGSTPSTFERAPPAEAPSQRGPKGPRGPSPPPY